jgi:hypothetical protein
MWPYTNDEQVWLEPSKDWAKGRLRANPLPAPANDDQPTEDTRRPLDPQIFIGK